MMNKIMALAAGVFMGRSRLLRKSGRSSPWVLKSTKRLISSGTRGGASWKERASMKGITGDLRLEIDQQNAVRRGRPVCLG